ncbi:hypothetical protein [Vibrio syngnathi]|uniref:hypothetical protein n=1 Tax=Vibrio syngnathi TaxID=3034029 RepID=UPI0018DFB610|nr:hypothetical protein [Vibrio syngnathi]
MNNTPKGIAKQINSLTRTPILSLGMYKDPMNKTSSNRVSYLDLWYLEAGCKIEKLFKVSTVVLFLVNLFMGCSEFITNGDELVISVDEIVTKGYEHYGQRRERRVIYSK